MAKTVRYTDCISAEGQDPPSLREGLGVTLHSHSDSLRLGVEVSVRVPCMGQIELFNLLPGITIIILVIRKSLTL